MFPQARPELPARDVRREVPGDDEPHDAERLAEGGSDASGDRNRLAAVLVDRARVEVEDLRDHPDLTARAGDGLADVARLDPGELLGVVLDEGCEAPEKTRPVCGRHRSPCRVRFPGPSDGLVGLLHPGLLELRDRLLGGRVDDGERHGP